MIVRGLEAAAHPVGYLIIGRGISRYAPGNYKIKMEIYLPLVAGMEKKRAFQIKRRGDKKRREGKKRREKSPILRVVIVTASASYARSSSSSSSSSERRRVVHF